MRTYKLSWSRSIRKQRTVYRFGSVWAQAFLIAVPWINVLLVFGLLFAVHNRMVINPGVVMDLPREPLREGTYTGMTALMITVTGDTAGQEETLVFLDDERYLLQDGDQMGMFADRVKSRIAAGLKPELLLLADRRVSHGDVIRLVNAAREAGIERVNVGEKPK